MLLTVKSASDKSAVSVSMIRNLMRRGALPRIRIGRCVRIAEADLQKFVDDHRDHRSAERAS